MRRLNQYLLIAAYCVLLSGIASATAGTEAQPRFTELNGAISYGSTQPMTPLMTFLSDSIVVCNEDGSGCCIYYSDGREPICWISADETSAGKLSDSAIPELVSVGKSKP